MSSKEEFKKYYQLVFNEDGSVKNCGRATCAQLIMLAQTIDAEKDYGNAQTGVMNIINIKNLRSAL